MMRKRLHEDERLALCWRETVYQAVRDLALTGEATPEEREASRTWIFSDSKAPHSFLWACSVAGLDPEEVRGELRARGIG